MCGIAGIYRRCGIEGADLNKVELMLQTIKHRGPDATYATKDCDQVAMGIVRLSMVDPNGSQQPIFNESRTVVVVFNGEIYNYKKLRTELQARGHRFFSNGDGEVIAHLYEDDPLNFAQKLDGMFAFALYDKVKQRLLLGRDQYGIKPLYYSEFEGGIAFASELKSLTAHCARRPEVNTTAVQQYLALRFIPAPTTIFSDMYKVEPGTIKIFSASGSHLHRYYQWDLHTDRKESESLREVFEESILGTSEGDQDIGVFLSGGLDSSIIAAVMAKRQKLHTFTVGYEISGFPDERSYAAEVAAHIGSRHHEIILKDRDVVDLLPLVIWHLDEPLYTSVGLSSYAVAALASKYVKGVMSGDGSDELLMGYRYLAEPFAKAQCGEDWMSNYLSQIGWLKGRLPTQLLAESDDNMNAFAYSFFDSPPNISPFEKMRWFELTKRLPDYHLVRMDRLSMAHGLEVRVPYLRNAVVDAATAHAPQKLVSASNPKVLLKKSFNDLLPKHLVYRNKQPFTAPIDRWLNGVLKNKANSLFNDSSIVDGLGFSHNSITKIHNDYINGKSSYEAVWGIFMLMMWYDGFKNSKN